MKNHEAGMKVYVQLAVISDQKHQPQVRDRFLLLAGVEACRAGWLDVAAQCHDKLIAANPAHQAARHASMADALRDPEFQLLVNHWERYCPFEKAEAMLRPHRKTIEDKDLPIGDQMLKWLEQICIKS